MFKAGVSNGSADHDINIFGGYIEYARNLNKINLGIRATFLSQSSDAARTSGPADLYVNGSYQICSNQSAGLGLKIPLHDGNISVNGFSLPMDYQTSLGTLDLIANYSLQIKKIQLTLAIQQPLTQNKNEFDADRLTTSSPFKNYQSTRNFKRSGDLLLRVSYPIKIVKKLTVTPSLLPVYHLSEDSYTNYEEKVIKIKGSDGLTLNGNIFLNYAFNDASQIELSFGTPFVVRKTRPDGLTRSYVIGLEYKLAF